VTERIRHDWFTRFLDDPLRIYPGTPMPAILRKNESQNQKEILWAYLSQGKLAQNPKPRPPIPIPTPKPGEPPLVPQIPIQLPDGKLVESITVLYSTHDAIVYDVAKCRLHSVYTGARILRQVNTWRSFQLDGTQVEVDFPRYVEPKMELLP